MNPWILLSPEYPPAIGGIAEYVAQLAAGLYGAGDSVEVFAPAPAADDHASSVSVHELARGYDAGAFRRIHATLRTQPDAVTVLQYVPFLFSHPARLAQLLAWPGRLWVMFHEAAYPFEAGQAFRHRVLAAGTHVAARALVARAERVLVSTPGCEAALDKLVRSRKPAVWLPIPSNLARSARPRARASVLRQFGLDPARPIVGHFSTFGERVADTLRRTLKLVLAADSAVQVLVVGQGSEAFAERLVSEQPGTAERVRAGGRVTSELAGEAIDASDVLVFPYPDGISTRRTTAMAGLAFGKALVTTIGPNTEAVWQREGCVELCPVDPAALAERTRALLADPVRRSALGEKAERVYHARFALERAVDVLRGLRSAAC